ncbi:hypothetical protein [Salinibacterium sp. SWN248]|uniref:hypothetical protein n=1 Tax=Salinibacterium sp. SWN248 TaxID=2792056 RepID=UPI0018CCC446|nr:hypothetical protein [Salinibacterium sp. SWN248]MBH0024636.1 hypothetical protein [Salinibacterium sp. SWN248]
MVGDVLVECKTSERISNQWIRNALLQLLGYALLDFEDSLHIRHLAIWAPRRKATQVWSLNQILDTSADDALPKLREDFRHTLITLREQRNEEAKARHDELVKWRANFEAERRAQEDLAALQAQEKKGRRRESDRNRIAAKRAAT